jgi:hypothetical protein
MKKHMKRGMLLVGTILMLASGPAFAADGANRNDGELYRANELSMDLFGTASLGKYTIDHLSGSRVRHNSRLGAGIGMTYFVTRNIGFGGDVYSESTKHSLIDNAEANVYFRFPLGESGFAPYLIGGGGYQFDTAHAWFAQGGAGIEFRFTPQVGIFTDARLVVPEKTKYYGVARLGMRFAF